MTDTLWYTRCPVPTASGLAHSLGWLGETATDNGLKFGVLQDAGPELAGFHFSHELSGLIREGGNVPALAARAQGSPTRLIGLTWIDESQAILVGPQSQVTSAAQLAGLRIGIPAWAQDRARSFPRAMALHGFTSALRLGGLTLADVRVVELEVERDPQVRTEIQQRRTSITWGVEELLNGTVDAVYVKGARAQEVAAEHGLRVAIDLDATDTRRLRVNNGTPRPITVHQELLDTRPDVVIGFLAQSLRAADWAAGDLDGVRAVLQRETLSGPEGVVAAYGEDFHRGLHPSLSDERIDLLGVQQQFLYTHGFLAADFDLRSWVAPEPLAQARALVAAGATA
ncbi:ABC transporter substrate-binding protein [Nocardia sp. NBC_00511]|uniref:ABC transporter substrate-binding protein n=1 Tax=Nocardia sp. NBC_00511 TaxID=2903591 RepID=UPI0030E2F6BB